MASTNDGFMCRALSINHIYERCIPNVNSLIVFSKINKTSHEIMDGIPFIENDIDQKDYKINIYFTTNTMNICFYFKLFESLEEFFNLVDQLDNVFFDSITLWELHIYISKSAIENKSRLNVLIEMVNHFLIRVKKLEKIEILLRSIHDTPRQEIDGEGRVGLMSTPHEIFDLNIILHFLCCLQMKNIRDIILIDINLHFALSMIENNKFYEKKLLVKFKKLKKFLLCFDGWFFGEKPYETRLTKALETFDPTIFSILMLSNRFNLAKSHTCSLILKKNGKQNFMNIQYDGLMYGTDLFTLLPLKHNLDCNLANITLNCNLNYFDIPTLDTSGNENFKYIKNLSIDSFFLAKNKFPFKESNPEQLPYFKKLLSLMVNLKNVIINVNGINESIIPINKLKEYLCSFSKTVESLTISRINFDLTDFNIQINAAYPNLKSFTIFDIIHYNRINGRRKHVLNIQPHFYKMFKNLEVLTIPCVKMNQLTFPIKLRKIFITCKSTFNESFHDNRKKESLDNNIQFLNQQMNQTYSSIDNFKTELQKKKCHEECLCSINELFLRNVRIGHNINDTVKFLYFKDIRDLDSFETDYKIINLNFSFEYPLYPQLTRRYH